MRRLFEKKEDIIRKMNLSDKEKAIIINFFNDHPEQDKKCKEFGIDWNDKNTPFEKFFNLMNTFNERFLPKLTLADLTEGKDYQYLGEDNYYKYYFIYSYKGSVTIASNNVEPAVWTSVYGRGYDTAISMDENAKKDYPIKVEEDGSILKGGAKWCTAMNHTDSMWKSYTDGGSFFIYTCAKDKNLVGYQKVAVRLEWSSTKEMYTEADSDFREGRVYNIIYEFISEHNDTVSNCKENFRALKDEEKKIAEEKKKQKEQEIKAYINSLPGIELKYRNSDFPMIKMGHRKEGDVYGSLYLLPDIVPFSPQYSGRKYYFGCNRWDISIVRQWLNSDLPAGQWYKEYEVDNEKVDWSNTPSPTKDFIENTDGFLRKVGLSKSQLTPVKNITYTTEGKEIITEDYIWIPSLTELSTKSDHKEGQPLEYWQKLLGNNADCDSNRFRAIKVCYDIVNNSFDNAPYWTRSAGSECSNSVRYIGSGGSVYWLSAYYARRLPILACFKSN